MKDTHETSSESRSSAPAQTGRKTGGRLSLWTISLVSAIAVVAVTVVGVSASGLVRVSDTAGADGSQRIAQQVSQTLLTSYCPSQVGLADQESYGDSEFSVSQGDLSSSARFASIGSVYSSTLSSIAGKQVATLASGEDSLALGGQKAQQASILSSTLLSADAGTGSTGTVASWASDGDVQGLAATPCSSSHLTSSFLVPQTTTGMTDTLVVANTSDKPTSVKVSLWGTTSSQRLAASTNTSLTVKAHAETSLDLSAAAPDQKGLFVTVSSQVVPVFSTVKVTSAEGLTPHGVDYVPAASSIAASAARGKSAVLTGVEQGQKVALRVFSTRAQSLTVSWMGSDGTKQKTTADIEAHKVAVLDLGSVPAKTSAIKVESSDETAKLYASATAIRGSDKQDFSVVTAQPTVSHSAITLPDEVDGTAVLANAGASDAQVSLEGFDDSGKLVATTKKTVSAGHAISVKMADMGKARTLAMTSPNAAEVSFAATLTSKALDTAHVEQAATIGATSLMPQTTEVDATRSLLASVE